MNHGNSIRCIRVNDILGCTDEVAPNYNPDANIDDSSDYDTGYGEWSLNFDDKDDYVYVGV